MFYKDEKRRMGNAYKVFIFILLFINLVNLMYSVTFFYNTPNAIYTPVVTEEYSPYISFLNVGIWRNFSLVLLYMNYKLFYIKEQGQRVFLPKKYEITPLTLREIYAAKFRIIINASVIYLLCSIGFYYFVLFMNQYPFMDYKRNAIEIVQTVLIIAGMIALLFLWDRMAYVRGEKANG